MDFNKETKLPNIPALRDDNVLDVVRALKEYIEVRENLTPRSDPLDSSVTFRDLYQSGIATIDLGSALKRVTSPSHPIIAADPDKDYSVPQTPTGLVANAGIVQIILTWDFVSGGNVSHAEVWRNETNNLTTAIKIGSSTGSVYSDGIGSTGATKYYWIRYVSTAGVNGAFAGPVSATTGVIGTNDLGPQIITAGKLATGAIDLSQPTVTGLLPNTKLDVITNAAKVQDGLISELKLANSAVTAAKTSLAAIDPASGNLTANSVSTNQLTANAVTSPKIQAGNVLAEHMAIGNMSNACYNSGFDVNLDGWTLGTANNGEVAGRNLAATWTLGNGTAYIQQPNASNNAPGYVEYVGQRFEVKAGDSWGIAVHAQGHRCYVWAYIAWYDATDTYLSATALSPSTANTNPSSGNKVADYEVLYTRGIAPTNAVFARHVIRKGTTISGADSYAFFTRVMVSQVYPNQSVPPAWVPAGVTLIHGGVIKTNTVAASQLIANTITAGSGVIANGAILNAMIDRATVNKLAVTDADIVDLNAAKITAGFLDANRIQVGSLDAKIATIGDAQISSLSGSKITAQTISADKLTIGTGRNYIRDGTFVSSLGVQWVAGSDDGAGNVFIGSGAVYQPTYGSNELTTQYATGPATASSVFAYQDLKPSLGNNLVPNKKYLLSFYTRCNGNGTNAVYAPIIRSYDSANAFTDSALIVNKGSGFVYSGTANRQTIAFQAPAAAAMANGSRIHLRYYVTAGVASFANWNGIMLEELPDSANLATAEPSPYKDNGSTVIDGGTLYASTIITDKLVNNAVTVPLSAASTGVIAPTGGSATLAAMPNTGWVDALSVSLTSAGAQIHAVASLYADTNGGNISGNVFFGVRIVFRVNGADQAYFHAKQIFYGAPNPMAGSIPASGNYTPPAGQAVTIVLQFSTDVFYARDRALIAFELKK